MSANNKSQIKENIYTLFDRLWHKQILEVSKENIGNSKLRTCKEFKVNLNLKEYLTCVSFRAHRVALARFRISAHQLRIETGRYQTLEDKDRICLLCDSGEIESGIHLLMDCSYFSDKRRLFFNFVQQIIPNF